MWFADAYVTAFYTLDQRGHSVAVRLEAGPSGGNAVNFQYPVAEGGEQAVAIKGSKDNRISVELIVRRTADRLEAKVHSETLPQQQASN